MDYSKMTYNEFLESFEHCNLTHSNHTKKALLDDQDFSKVVDFVKSWYPEFNQMAFIRGEEDVNDAILTIADVVQDVVESSVNDFGNKYGQYPSADYEWCAEQILCDLLGVSDLGYVTPD